MKGQEGLAAETRAAVFWCLQAAAASRMKCLPGGWITTEPGKQLPARAMYGAGGG